MRIFSRALNKLSGRQETKFCDLHPRSVRHANASDLRKDEFSDWPQSLLSIGTLDNSKLGKIPQTTRSSQDLNNLTVEEVDRLEKEIDDMLARKCESSTDEVNSQSSRDLSLHSEVVVSKARDLVAGNQNALQKKSVSFLLKKMFVCKGGFTPAPEMRAPFPESRMEKIWRAIIHKKIHQIHVQNSATTKKRKYLESKTQEESSVEEEKQEKGEDGSKWIKTDSEFIVLEI